MTRPPDSIPGLPLEERALMALKGAVEKVIEEHMRVGLPINIWGDGKAVAVQPEELRPLARP